VIFSRRRGNAGRHSAGTNGPGKRGSTPVGVVEDADEGTPQGAPEFGPYDLIEAPHDGQERLDLGALRVPAVGGVEIHLQAGPQGQIQQIQLVYGGSRLALAAYAAPRTEGIWAQVRETLRQSLVEGGAHAEVTDGDYGPELRAKLRDGATSTEVRHVGIDGPRWFVHAVFLGAAAFQPDQAGPLSEVLRGLVVDRGNEARPVQEALPLRLPPEAAAQLADATAPDKQAT
jgi:hypothetical protein